MHLIMILTSLSLAFGIRSIRLFKFFNSTSLSTHWDKRWQFLLGCFAFPPLLLLTTAIAIVVMGPKGQILFPWDGWLSYGCAIAFLASSGLVFFQLLREGQNTLYKIRTFTTLETEHCGSQARIRILETPLLYSAQVGFWEPELVVSQGLMETLSPEHFKAVLIHEQAHYYYRDTFCFFGLGWLRRISDWLPESRSLWQELLTMRELRADRWAAQRTDALLIAEALLQVVQTQPVLEEAFCVAFGNADSPSRLAQRIETLLNAPPAPEKITVGSFSWLGFALVPLLAIPFHH